MKFRIFYAPQIFRTWEKVFVLTEDGKLYCQYLMRFKTTYIQEENIDYENFRAQDYKWGKGVQGENGTAFTNYQECKEELSWESYESLSPSDLLSGYKFNDIEKQIYWVKEYISDLGLSSDNWDNRFTN
tara:strand:+ start:938 stop:1324 length:387 start_codon:yes stop_codon:yes gene_type:complete